MTAHLLDDIRLLRLPVRPGRSEPHAIKRRPRIHPLLTLPRTLAREKIRRAPEKMAKGSAFQASSMAGQRMLQDPRNDCTQVRG